jgi:uncharacterized protein (TIGR02145 family)
MRKKINLTIILMMMVAVALICCKEDDKEVSADLPAITSINPASAAPGAIVKIDGANFSEIIAENVVKFNEVKAITKAASKNQLSVEVPAQAKSGKVTLTVKGKTVDGPIFNIITTPAITSISPVKGLTGTVVEISCSNFEKISDYKVLFNGKEAAIQSSTLTKISVKIPESTTTGKVTITYDGKTIEGPTFTIVPTPSISEIKPLKGLPGSTVEITGTNFSTIEDEHTISFDGIGAEVQSVSETKITVIVPENAKSGKIMMGYLGQVFEGFTFMVLPIPAITKISPAEGYVGSTLTITGENFSTIPNDFLINIDGENAEIISVTSTEIKVKVPYAAPGKVKMEYQGKTIEGFHFKVLPEPKIDLVSPTFGEEGSLIKIMGNHYSSIIEDFKVLIGGIEAGIEERSYSSLTVKVPAGVSNGLLTIKTKEGLVIEGPQFIALKDGKGSFVDARDGKTYGAIKIGSQLWMTENLNYDVPDDNTDGCYGNNSNNCATYGRLYSFETATKAVPAGWRIPSDEDWKELEIHLGMSKETADVLGYWRGNDEGTKIGPSGSSGLNLPYGGCKTLTSKEMKYIYSEDYGYYWSSSIHPNNWVERIYRSITDLTDKGYNKQIHNGTLREGDTQYFLSVRCIKN